MPSLSPKQQRIINFINRFVTENGYPPSIRDIVYGCGISSTSVVSYNLNKLEQARLIRRHPDVSRGIELMKGITPSLPMQVPIIGYIAAGEPIPVPTADTWDVTAAADKVEVTDYLTQGKSDIYALRIRGTSMVDALISDGDMVLMQYVNMVENGEMAAVWLKAEKEVTLKKFYAEEGHIRLQPANSQMKPIFTTPDNIEIQGRVIAVLRRTITSI